MYNDKILSTSVKLNHLYLVLLIFFTLNNYKFAMQSAIKSMFVNRTNTFHICQLFSMHIFHVKL